MVKRVGGLRRGSRRKMTKPQREKSKLSITRFFQEFKPGDKVVLKAEPSYPKGMAPLRYHGRIGTIVKRTGSCYEVSLIDIKKPKVFIIHPVHLRGLKE